MMSNRIFLLTALSGGLDLFPLIEDVQKLLRSSFANANVSVVVADVNDFLQEYKNAEDLVCIVFYKGYESCKNDRSYPSDVTAPIFECLVVPEGCTMKVRKCPTARGIFVVEYERQTYDSSLIRTSGDTKIDPNVIESIRGCLQSQLQKNPHPAMMF